MAGLVFTEAVGKRHAPLVQRAAAIAASHGAAAEECRLSVELRDAADRSPAPPRTPVVALEHGTEPCIVRESASRITLVHADPASEASLAALLACSALPGMPIAADPESLSVLALAERLAVSDIPVLVNGPTGTGKEVLSRFIHARSRRADGPFVAVNCAAMPETMLEALLFGHQKGAFTGATQASEGFFRAADGGTLLLDEIAEMPLGLQAKLLRALQEGEVVPLGSTQAVKVDVRIIACANRDLPTEVAEGRFRADLYYRLNVFPLSLRPLRDRPDDIAPLAFALVLRHSASVARRTPGLAGQRMPWISDAALALLAGHGWPGNVRELENVIRRALLLADGQPAIGPQHIVFDSPARLVAPPAEHLATGGMHPASAASGDPSLPAVPAGKSGGKLSNIVQLSEARAIMETLEACGGSRVAAARQLGISERTLRYRLASFREAGIPMTVSRAVGGFGR